MTGAREQILAALRAGSRGASPSPLPAGEVPRCVPEAERVECFAAILARIGGHCERAPDLPAAAARVHAVLAAAGAQRVAVSDAPGIAAITAGLPATVRVLAGAAPRAELLAADAGVTFAQWGIAETGTLVLASASEQNRLASLLPALHVVVLPRSRLLGTLGDAFAALCGTDGAPVARTITFVTGPSRTADIELTLVVGVHGPKALHVVVVDGA